MEVGVCQIGGIGKLRVNILRFCCSCLSCAQNGVRSGVVMTEVDLIHLPVWCKPSSLLF